MADSPKSAFHPFARYTLLLAAGLVITIVTGVVCGRVSQRWGPVPDMLLAAKNLETVPTNIGTWQMVDEVKLPALIVETLQCAGYVNRKYLDRHTGNTVHLAIIVGPSGPVSVHTPEICFPSQAYSMDQPREVKQFADLSGDQHSFWTTSFNSTNAIGEQLRVYYGWCADKNWQAAEAPRFKYAGRPLLFKLQISSPVSPGKQDAASDPCQAFLERLLESGWKING